MASGHRVCSTTRSRRPSRSALGNQVSSHSSFVSCCCEGNSRVDLAAPRPMPKVSTMLLIHIDSNQMSFVLAWSQANRRGRQKRSLLTLATLTSDRCYPRTLDNNSSVTDTNPKQCCPGLFVAQFPFCNGLIEISRASWPWGSRQS